MQRDSVVHIRRFLFLACLFLVVSCMIGLPASTLAPWIRPLEATAEFTKGLLLWALPVVVWLLITASLAQFGRSAWRYVCSLMTFEFVANGAALLVGYGAGLLAHAERPCLSVVEGSIVEGLLPASPAWWSTTYASLVGVLSGLLLGSAPRGYPLLILWRDEVLRLLSWIMPPAARLIMVGYLAQAIHAAPSELWQQAPLLCGWLLLAMALYLLLLFALAARGHLHRMVKLVRAGLPAGAVATTSMCSIAALPWSLRAAEQNCESASFARVGVPLTVSVQMPGDCFINPFLVAALLPLYGVPYPDLGQFALFAFLFVLNRFAAVGIPGGAILLMLPLYEHILLAPPAFLALLIVCNRVLDPIVTAGNVMGNVAQVVLWERWHRLFSRREGLAMPRSL